MSNDQRTDNERNFNYKKEQGMNAAKAGAVGLLIGAVGTAAIMLADREVRKRAVKRAGDVRGVVGKWGNKTMRNISTTSKKTGQDLKNDLKEMKDKQKNIEAETKDKVVRSVH